MWDGIMKSVYVIFWKGKICMKNFIKVISLILALIMMAAAFASCNNSDENKNKKDPNANQTQTDSSESDIEVIDWDGSEYRILGRSNNTNGYSWSWHFEIDRDELPEDVVGKAVWERNLDMSMNYGINVKSYLEADCNGRADAVLGAGEDLYDLMLLSPEKFTPLSVQGNMLDLYSLDYINTEHDAWQDYPNEQLSMGGKLYYTTNKFLLQDKNRCWLFFYNREMAAELNLGHFEDLVFDGTWTIDKVVELAKQATSDSDGQPGMTKKDTWGVAVAEHYSFAQIAYGAGFRLTEQASDGYPELIGAVDNMMRRLDKVYTLTGNYDIYFCDQRIAPNGIVNYNDCAYHIFYDGRALFHPGVLSQLDSLLDTVPMECDFEYAPLPNPKFDEKQESYYSIPNLGNGSLLGVPATVIDTSFAGYALELISEKSVNTTYKAYIEDKCLLQDVVDEDAARCLRLVFDGIVYDVAFICNIGDLGLMMRNDLGKYSTNTFKRLFDANSKAANIAINEIRDSYASLYQ